MSKVVIAGGRDFDDYTHAVQCIKSVIKPDDEILNGGAMGADSLSSAYAGEYGHDVTVYPARWDQFGNRAGPIRNKEMARDGDILIAFWDGKSRGTRDMITRALAYGMEIHVFRYPAND